KTPFPAAILIHDDASTDRTGVICKEMQRQYPEEIVLIRESINQYETGQKITKDILLPLVQSPYTAFCEGDDCWIRRDKLTRQVTWMQNHPDAVLVCSKVRIREAEENVGEQRTKEKGTENEADETMRGRKDRTGSLQRRSNLLPDPFRRVTGFRQLSQREIFENWEGQITQLSSFLVKTDAFRSIPSSLQHHWFGDWVMITWLSLRGSVWYEKLPTSCYRIHSLGSVADEKGGPGKEEANAKEKLRFLTELQMAAGDEYQPFLQRETAYLQAKRCRETLLKALWQETVSRQRKEAEKTEGAEPDNPVPRKANSWNFGEGWKQRKKLRREIRAAAHGMLGTLSLRWPGRESISAKTWCWRDVLRDLSLVGKTELLLSVPPVLAQWGEAKARKQ
ncbi:MAG: glycosyltransferase, partial [Lachnospiraceae bacterium]